MTRANRLEEVVPAGVGMLPLRTRNCCPQVGVSIGQAAGWIAERSLFPIGALKREGPSEAIKVFNIELSRQSLNITPERMDLFRERYLSADDEAAKAGILGYIDTVNPAQSLFHDK